MQESGGGYFVDHADLDYNQTLGPIADPGDMQRFLGSAFERINLLFPEDPEPRLQLNIKELTRTASFHLELDKWSPPPGVKTYMVMGFNSATAFRYAEQRKADGQYKAEVRFSTRGDGTVTLVSGEAVKDVVDGMYWVDQRVTETAHGDYGFSRTVQDLVLSLLRGEQPRLLPPIYRDRNQVLAELQRQKTITVELFSPVTLDFVDGLGRRTGRDASGVPVWQVPGSNFISLGEDEGTESIGVPSGTSGTFIITPKQPTGHFTVKVVLVSAEGETTGTTVYQNVPLAGPRRFYLAVDQAGGTGLLLLDSNGDGQGDQIIPPTLVTDGDAPPVTFATLAADVQWALAEGGIANHGIAESLRAKLASAQRAWDRGDRRTALHHLDNFARFLETQRGQHVEENWADGLGFLAGQLAKLL